MSYFDYKCGSFDTSDYPIVKAKLHADRPSSQDIKEYLEALIRVLKQKSGNFALYIDASESKWLGKEEREITYVGMKYIQEEFKGRYRAHYILISSIIIRILIRLIFGMSKKRVIQKIFSSHEKLMEEINNDMESWP